MKLTKSLYLGWGGGGGGGECKRVLSASLLNSIYSHFAFTPQYIGNVFERDITTQALNQGNKNMSHESIIAVEKNYNVQWFKLFSHTGKKHVKVVEFSVIQNDLWSKVIPLYWYRELNKKSLSVDACHACLSPIKRG